MVDRPPSIFSLYLGVYIFFYAKSKLIARPIPVLYWPEKYYSSCQVYTCCYVLIILRLGRIWNFFHKLSSRSNFAYSATVQPRLSSYFISMKISVLPPTQQNSTVIELTTLHKFYKYQHSFNRSITTILHFISTIISCSLFV